MGIKIGVFMPLNTVMWLNFCQNPSQAKKYFLNFFKNIWSICANFSLFQKIFLFWQLTIGLINYSGTSHCLPSWAKMLYQTRKNYR